MSPSYGAAPTLIAADFNPDWTEYMHYLYLPVVMPGQEGVRLPERLEFLRPVIDGALVREFTKGFRYVYVTARRGYATPGNPLNRPGWHADGFGTPDINYIWSDRWPTRFALGTFAGISDDHVVSAKQFEDQIWHATDSGFHRPRGWKPPIVVGHGEPRALYRLDASVIHSTPVIPEPGGERSFFKVSLSNDRYNLVGNSHNYLFDYDWRMWSRDEVRNDPAYAGGDSGPQRDDAEVVR